MRYFIGYLMRGEAAEYFKATCSDIATRFGIEDVSSIVPPHITVKAPFDRIDGNSVDEIISLIADAPAIPITLSEWNHFGTRTIFLDATNPPPELKTYIKSVLSKFRSLGIMPNPQEHDPHIHMSIARFLKPEQYEEVWKYLNAMPAPKFDIMFDNLTIFVKENRDERIWKTLKTFPLTGKR